MGTTRSLRPLPNSLSSRESVSEVVDDEPHRLGDAGAGGVENLQQRSVAQAHRGVVDAGGLQEDADLIDP